MRESTPTRDGAQSPTLKPMVAILYRQALHNTITITVLNMETFSNVARCPSRVPEQTGAKQ